MYKSIICIPQFYEQYMSNFREKSFHCAKFENNVSILLITTYELSIVNI